MSEAIISITGTATDVCRQLDSPERCASWLADHQEAYDAVRQVWTHVQGMLMVAGRGGTPIDAGGGRLVCVEPSAYDVDQVVVKELAPEAIRTVELETSESVKRIHELAGEAIEDLLGALHPDAGLAEVISRVQEILKLSQPETVEQVDGRRLNSILQRGDGRALQLVERQVKKPTRWKIAVRTS